MKFPDLSKHSISQGTADFYRFDFSPHGWAIFTINEGTGEFSIQSDWGSYSYRWNINSLPEDNKNHEKPLTHFLGKRSPADYVVDKLSYDKSHSFKEEFSPEKTVRALKEHLLESRREEYLDKEKTRRIWTHLTRAWEGRLSYDPEQAALTMDDRSEALDFFEQRDTVRNHIGREISSFFEYQPSYQYSFLLEKLLPFFFDYLRREILKLDPIKI